MNLDKQTIKMTVRKIVKQQSCGLLLYQLYFSVPSIRSKTAEVKPANIIGPMACVTSKHSLPTTEGWKSAEDIRIGDVVLFNLDLIT
jgi:hypothetical protein